MACLRQMGNGLCPPPATNLVLFGSSIFSGQIKHVVVMSPYVTSSVLSFGTMCRGMKKIVSVPFARPGIPCASRPSAFPYEWVHVALVLGFAMRCRYSSSGVCRFLPSLSLPFHRANSSGMNDSPSFVPILLAARAIPVFFFCS